MNKAEKTNNFFRCPRRTRHCSGTAEKFRRKKMMEENSSLPLAVGEVAAEIKEQLKYRENLCKAFEVLPVLAPDEFRKRIDGIKQAYETSAAPPPEYAELID